MLNLLEIWYDYAWSLSSDLSIYPKRVSRKNVDFIKKVLSENFPPEYFIIKKGESKSIEKSSWILSLLANKSHLGCMGALYKIAILFEYAKGAEKSLQNDLTAIKENPKNLRSFFFELSTYHFLDKCNIQNEKKVLENGQVLEGTCVLFGKNYLFECKKAFLPNVNELNTKMRISTEFITMLNHLGLSDGIVCSVKLNAPIKGNHYTQLERIIKEYVRKYKELGHQINNPEYCIQEAVGTFRVVNYDIANLIEARELKPYDILFYSIPPRDAVPGMTTPHRCNIISQFNIKQEVIEQKFERILKKAKQQHRNSSYQNKIIFLDSETIPELEMGLFFSEQMFDSSKLKSIYDKLNMQEIVFVTRRHFDEFNPKISMTAFFTAEHKQTAEYLLKTFKTYKY